MSMNKTYAVLGLGRYGHAVATQLVKSGVEVLAVDQNEAIVNAVATELPLCKCADVTDPDAFRAIGISNVDVVIVAMANSLEASVMAITLCKEAGVKTVIAKCGTEMQKSIFLRVGADEVVFPEHESGTRLAKNLLSAGFADLVSLSDDVSMVELDVADEWVGKNLIELNLRKKHGMNVVALCRHGKVEVELDPTQPLARGEQLVVIANTAKLAKFHKK